MVGKKVVQCWLSVDPLTKGYPSWTPYAFAMNRVIDGVDLDGLEWQPYNSKGQKVKLNSKDISEYRWVGYTEIAGYTSAYDNATYSPNSSTGMWLAFCLSNGISYGITPVLLAPKGTVENAQVISENNGITNVTVYTVDNNKNKRSYKQRRTPWIDKAKSQIGIKEDLNKDANNPEVVKYLNYDGVPSDMRSTMDKTAWCGAFVNYCLEESGYTGESTNPLAVENWMGMWNNWTDGVQIDEPEYGALVTFGNNHIGFVVGLDGKGNLYVLGGNQDDEVNISIYPIKSNFEYFMPSNYNSTPLDKNQNYLKSTFTGTAANGGSTK
ncbi:MAG: TIGR02594 family protein [Sphingobacteriales bacterium]|nr:TIGR02594 family protein [Sphingobacteriales bacterium]